MYQFYLGEILLPIAPEKVTITTGSQSHSITMADGKEINIPESPKLRIINFEALIPYIEYPFARYVSGYKDGDTLREDIEALKNNNTIFQFVITRLKGQKVYHYTDIRSTLEDIKVTEAAQNGYDIKMALTIKEYREFGAKFVTNNSGSIRQQDNAPKTNSSYTVKSGDSLWSIAKKYYDDGSRWREIYNANTDKIANPNVIKTGLDIVIPEVS